MSILGIIVASLDFPHHSIELGFTSRIFLNRRVNPFFCWLILPSSVFLLKNDDSAGPKRKKKISVSRRSQSDYCRANPSGQSTHIGTISTNFDDSHAAASCGADLPDVVLCEYQNAQSFDLFGIFPEYRIFRTCVSIGSRFIGIYGGIKMLILHHRREHFCHLRSFESDPI